MSFSPVHVSAATCLVFGVGKSDDHDMDTGLRLLSMAVARHNSTMLETCFHCVSVPFSGSAPAQVTSAPCICPSFAYHKCVLSLVEVL